MHSERKGKRMSHDFAKKPKKSTQNTKKPNRKNSPAKSRPQSQVPGWVWLFTGIVTGIFLCFLAFLADITPEKQAAKTSAAAKKTTTQEDPQNTTRFDFYTLLPEREVIVPEEQASSNNNQPQQEIIYMLQAGSFKNADDADRLRAKLILLGLDTKVEAVSGKGNGTWHRVQVGPFKSRSKLSATRNTLIAEGIETLLLKRKVES